MKILLIGNGGRENAIAWKIYNSNSFHESKSKLYNTIGNPGINKFAEPINIKPTDINSLVMFARTERIDFTVVGPEVPLSLGIVNEFEKNGLKIFGPKDSGAMIESSKIFAKNLMLENNIPTAKYKTFAKDNIIEVRKFLNSCTYPVVFKADGLAGGKGVVIINNSDEAEYTIREFFENGLSVNAGSNFIIEEFLEGEEISVFVITDGMDYLILPFSQDHKKIFEGDKGKNTGGMGAVAPVKKFMNKDLIDKIKNKIVEPTLNALQKNSSQYKGCLYCGLMIVEKEPYIIEFNCRFGDPETQSVLPLIRSDFLQMLLASANGYIKNYKLEINDEYTCCVVLSSAGYPDKYEINKEVFGLDEIENDCLVFHSGTKFGEDTKQVLSYSGRVLSIVGISKISLTDAIRKAYDSVNKISFNNKYFRKDIGFRQLILNSKEEVIS